MRGSFLPLPKETRDEAPIFNSWQVTSAWFGEGSALNSSRGEKNKWTERKASIQCSQTHKLRSISSSHVQSYFIQKSTAITVSSHRQSWMCNFLHLLGSWQFDNQRTATAVLATKVLPLRQCLGFSASQACLDTHFCHYLPLPSLSRLMFIVAHSLWFSSQKSHRSHPLSLTSSDSILS